MKTYILRFSFLLFSAVIYAQAGHIMQGIGSINMSMGGAATGQPLDISGTLHWNPAGLSVFDGKTFKFDTGFFFSSPELSSSLPANIIGPGSPAVSGTTEDDRGVAILPNIAYIWGKEDSKHTFGLSAFGISGFGVTFPVESNHPLNSSFSPTLNSNPINYPQPFGFGRVESDYMLLQVGLTWAYELSEQFSVGIQPTINFGGLELEPNPLASPDPDLYYPKSKRDWATGIGAQFGVFYDSGTGFKAGASYKTVQSFSDFEFESTYLSGTSAPEVKFQMDYPAILSFGLGYSGGDFDLALDYRNVNYENTEGFEKSGWTIASEGPFDGYPTGSVKGFGWENISIVSAGIQYKGLEKVPLRIGYTYSSNPIPEELTFFSVPATAIIKNAFQFGLSYELSEKFILSGLFHYGDSGGSTSGPMLNPKPDEDLNMDGMPEGPWNASTNPLGEIPDSTVSYDMTTSMIMVGFTYNIMKKETEKQ